MTKKYIIIGTSAAGLAAATTVQFYVEATDALGAVSSYPARGTNSRALYVVQDNQAAAPPLHNFRIVMTPGEAAFCLDPRFHPGLCFLTRFPNANRQPLRSKTLCQK